MTKILVKTHITYRSLIQLPYVHKLPLTKLASWDPHKEDSHL